MRTAAMNSQPNQGAPAMEANQEEIIKESDKIHHPDDFLTAQSDSFDLKIGMITNSEEEAFDMYNKYATQLGFNARRDEKTYKRGTTELIRRSFVCSREGFRATTNPSEEKKYDRLDTRCGCRARVVFKVENGVYQISQLISEHNHELVEPSQRHLLRSARKIHDTSKGVIKSMANAGIRATQTYAYLLNEAGGYQQLGFTPTDCQNFIQVERSKRMAVGDGQSIINYFKKKQVENPMFFYTVQVDEDNRMCNFYWRDGISKLDYECFGDVRVLDTTYRTNKYNMICAPFVGVNHHWKNVLFGCAFLCDETAASFIWLFDAFLQSMDYKAPQTIFTDQDHAMEKAVAQVFPSTKHRLCQWHISKNAAVNIPRLLHESGFRDTFNFLLYTCGNESELEEKWKEMIDTWGCSNQSWLLKLYDIQKKWAPAFSRDTFSCNIRSSQMSESTNNVFQHMACKTMAFTEFVHHYEKNAEKMREVEVTDDFKCVYGDPIIKSRGSGILKHACKVYTNKLFRKFEDEFLQTPSYLVVEHIFDGTLHSYKIISEDGTREYIVHFNLENCTISCNCKLFESLGLLCRHALRVLNLNGVKTTYRTNKYNMICAPFVGVNHHWKNVLFGCAFLCDETAASFIWLFDAFLQSMDYKAPQTIFTDQDHAMEKAVAQVFPSTKHRLCQWHISKNAAVNIPRLLHESGFRDTFNFLLYTCGNESELEEKWKEMIDTWGCSNQSWLLKLYDIQKKWAPAFSRDTFSCNIRSSQMSESTNNVFQHMACKTMAFTEFVHHYEKNAEKMREVEVTDDFKCVYGDPIIKSRGSGILKHACKVYTNKLFRKFEDEFLQTPSYLVVEHIFDGTLHSYKIISEDGTREYIVHFNLENCTISCNCKLFESLGLLCRHALRVLNLNGVKTIPEQYILGRWTKVVKEGCNTERHAKVAQDNKDNSVKTLRLNRLMRKAFTLMNLAAALDGTTEIAKRNMDRTLDEVKRYRVSLSGKDVGEDSNGIPISASDYPVMDPLRLRQKGKTCGRMKGVLERKRKNSENVGRGRGRGKRQAIHAAMKDIEMESTILQPSRFYAQTSNVPLVDLVSLYSNVPFTSMTQSTISMSHGQGSSTKEGQSSWNLQSLSGD